MHFQDSTNSRLAIFSFDNNEDEKVVGARGKDEKKFQTNFTEIDNDEIPRDIILDNEKTMGVGTSSASGPIKKPYYGLTKLLVMKVALPHVGLLILIVVYTIFGAFIFKHLEQDVLAKSIEGARKNLTAEKNTFLKNIQSMIYNGSGSKSDSADMLQNYILKLYNIYSVEGGAGRYISKLTNRPNDPWTFDKSLFFGATTLASIGYGAQAPTTKYGRLFCIIFALFGLPLAVIMIADLAKFVSKFVVWCYTRYLMQKHQIRKMCCMLCEKQKRASAKKRRSRTNSAFNNQNKNNESTNFLEFDEDDEDEEEEIAEFLWTNLENAKFVEVPAILMFSIILLYVSGGALLFIAIEQWTFMEGFYFSIISILAIGFGDFTPKNDKFIYVSLFYVLFGLLLTTTCIDVVGIQYINKIHNIGRKLTKTDPLIWLRAVQERRLRRMKRHAMMALFNTLTAVNRMKFDPSVDRALQASTETSLDLALLNDLKQSKDPPSEPKNFRVESVSVYSVLLRWDPPLAGGTEDLHYLLSYRLSPLSSSTILIDAAPFECTPTKLNNHGSIRRKKEKVQQTINLIRHAPRKTAMTVVEPIYDNYFEVTSLRSFSLYHFSLTAENNNGRSNPVFTQEYTEPCSVPLNLRTDQITDNSVTLCWDSPVKNKEGERQYAVHYTNSVDRPMDEWLNVDVGPSKTFTAVQLAGNNKYAFTVSASHNGKLAIFSRSLQVQTKSMSSMKKLNTLVNCVNDITPTPSQRSRIINAAVSFDREC